MSIEKLTGRQIADAGLDGWANLLGGLQTRIETPDFVTGLQIVNSIGAAAEEKNHHPDLDLRYSHLDVRVSSHDVGGITERDLELARTISAIATAVGTRTTSTSVSRWELGLDSPRGPAIAPFWAAVLAGKHVAGDGYDDVLDPGGTWPLIWFQASGADEPRQHWHPDVWVAPEQVQPRIDAALDAGGTLVSDEQAPRFWVLADAEGNNVCLCTWQDRD